MICQTGEQQKSIHFSDEEEVTGQFHTPVFVTCSDNLLHDKTDEAGKPRLASREFG